MSRGGAHYELNLTAYIDLMSTLIVFLLMTAVWNHIAVLSTDSKSTTASDTPANDQDQINLSITILPKYMEMSENSTQTKLAHVDGKIDLSRMEEVLKSWKLKYPKKTDVILSTENSVTYKMMINAFDTLVGNEFPDVGVNTQ